MLSMLSVAETIALVGGVTSPLAPGLEIGVIAMQVGWIVFADLADS